MDSEPPNAIEQRLAKLSGLWSEFREKPDARICRWLVKEDEVQMLRGFIEVAQTPDSDVPDLFFPFNSAYINPETYSVDLVNELHTRLLNEKEKTPIDINWQPSSNTIGKDSAKHFVLNFSAFADALSTEVLCVAFFAPPTWSASIEQWIFDAIVTGIPEHIRLVVLDLETFPLFDKVAQLYPVAIQTIRPDLDMMTAMVQLASGGNPADPGVKFRKAFLTLSQAATKKDLPRFEQLAVEPLGIARQQGWMHLEVAVLALKGSMYLAKNLFQNAVDVYENARLIAQSAADQGNSLGQTLAMQMLLSKGAACIAMKDYMQAAENYSKAGDKADEAKDFYQVMESRRMQGYCLEQSKNKQDALDTYYLSLEAGEKIEPSIRENSTLPYVGKALSDLAATHGSKEDFFVLENRLNKLFGPQWQAKHAQKVTAI